MKRGDMVVAEAPGDLTDKPRPYVIVQTQHSVAASRRITMCPVSSQLTNSALVRVMVEPSEANGLAKISEVAVDLVTTLTLVRIKQHIGTLANSDLARVDEALRRHLDL